ncbi:MAG: amidase signature domain-containing protein [Monoraphidium minutum]|nr:MAG: amidase signature domain-containing protein [Monoraphidium minutum]
MEPAVAAACRAAAAWFAEYAAAGGGGSGALVEASPAFGDARRLFRVLRAVSCFGWLEAIKQAPGARDVIKSDCVWQWDDVLSTTAADVAWAEAAHDALLASRDAFFAEWDLLASPAAMMDPFPVEKRWPTECCGEAFTNYIDWLRPAAAVSLLGGPAICVPCGFTVSGLPVGLSLAGPPGAERRVLAAAAAYEAAHGWAAAVPRDPPPPLSG